MALRAWLARTRQRTAVVLAVMALAAAVVVHHGAPHPMDGMHADHAMAAAAMCLGTIVTALAVVAVVGLRRRTPARDRHPMAPPPAVLRLSPTAPLPRARSSPLYLRYAVLRR